MIISDVFAPVPFRALKITDKIPEWCHSSILMGYRGSHAHGTFIPNSDPESIDDIDVFNICVQPQSFYLGLDGYNRKQDHHETSGQELDILTYDIRKFIHLLRKGNPNVHSFLWCNENDYFLVEKPGRYLIDNRWRFLSQSILQSLGGYAYGQLHKMEHFERKGYMGEKRKKLVEKYNYDCKNAAHCFRLLWMGCELCRTGKLVVKLPPPICKEIMKIKTGHYTLWDVKKLAEDSFREFERLRKETDLPPMVPTATANKILLDTLNLWWYNCLYDG